MMTEANGIPWSCESAIVPAEAVDDMRKMNHNWNSVPLVLCRDCKHMVGDCESIWCRQTGRCVNRDGFCSWGERDE